MTPEDLPANVGSGAASPLPAEPRQHALDAALALQSHRSEAAAALARGRVPQCEVVAVGTRSMNDWLAGGIDRWREVLSARPAATATQLRASLPTNRRWYERGISMVSAFDWFGTSPEARLLLANEPVGDYLMSAVPVQMKLVDRRAVVLQGPEVDGFQSLMSVSTPGCLEAAWRYWEAILASSIPAQAPSEARLTALTGRQRQVLALLTSDFGDEAIAASLGVSVRTVRSDVAAVLATLGVRTRFAAAVRLERLGELD